MTTAKKWRAFEMNAQQAFEAGYAPFQEIQILHDNGKPCGIRPAGRYEHHAYGSSWIVTGILYHRDDGRIGLAHGSLPGTEGR